MSALFSSPPKPPTPPAAMVAPTVDMARQKQMAEDAAAGRKGRAATILTSQAGDLAPPTTSAKTLLGS